MTGGDKREEEERVEREEERGEVGEKGDRKEIAGGGRGGEWCGERR